MADSQAPGFTHSLPTRTITVTGERTANMVRSTIRVSQIETRIIQMSMIGSSQVTSAVNRAAEDFQRAYNAFEASLKAIANDLEVSRRPGARKRGGSTQQRPAANAAQAKPQGQKGGKAQGEAVTLKAKPAKSEQPAAAKAETKTKAPTIPKADAKAPAPAPVATASEASAIAPEPAKVAAPKIETPAVPDTLQSL